MSRYKRLLKAGKQVKETAKKVEKKVEKVLPPTNGLDNLTLLRAKYKELYGKKPFMGWKEDKLKEMIRAKS
jgi:hypothetical protein